MTLSIRLEAEAEAELQAAAQWYDQRRLGLGTEFVAAVDGIFAALAERRVVGTRLPGLPSSHPARRVLLRRFPYAVAFVEKDEVIRIIAIAHERRRPDYWMGRLRS